MSNFSNQTKEINYNGEKHSIYIVKSGHTFTDSEIETMENGGKVLVSDGVKKDGSSMSPFNAYIGISSYNNKVDICFEFIKSGNSANMVDVFFNGKTISINRNVSGYTLTNSDIERLSNGEKIYCDKFVKKNGDKFTAYMYLGFNNFLNKEGVCFVSSDK